MTTDQHQYRAKPIWPPPIAKAATLVLKAMRGEELTEDERERLEEMGYEF